MMLFAYALTGCVAVRMQKVVSLMVCMEGTVCR